MQQSQIKFNCSKQVQEKNKKDKKKHEVNSLYPRELKLSFKKKYIYNNYNIFILIIILSLLLDLLLSVKDSRTLSSEPIETFLPVVIQSDLRGR